MRLLKQLFYGVLLVLIFGGLAYGVYAFFIKPSPTCTDGIKNGSETGVDCGGRCNKECLPEDIREVSVRGSVQVLQISTTTSASVLVQIQNLNSDYAARLDYVLNIKNSSGKVVMSSVGKNFIYSGEIKYLVFPNLSFEEDPAGLRGEFKIEKNEWVKEENMRKPSVFVTNENTKIFTDHIEVSGKFTNADARPISKAQIIAVLYDNRGNIIGASHTEASDIPPGEARAFVVLHPFISGVNASRTQVFVYPYPN